MTRGLDRDPVSMDWWTSIWRKPDGRWPGVRWGFSLLVPVAIVLWLVIGLLVPDRPDVLTIRAVSQVTGEGIVGATILVGDERYIANDEGEIRIMPVPEGTEVVVSAFGHGTVRASLDDGSGSETVSLSGVMVYGSVVDVLSDQPVENAELTVVDASGTPVASTRTDEMGGFVFKMIPEEASIRVSHAVYGESVIAIEGRRTLSLPLEPPPVSGRIVDDQGSPLANVAVAGPQSETVTDDEGRFTLSPVGQGAEIVVTDDGSGTVTVVVDGVALGDIVLTVPEATPDGIATPFSGSRS